MKRPPGEPSAEERWSLLLRGMYLYADSQFRRGRRSRRWSCWIRPKPWHCRRSPGFPPCAAIWAISSTSAAWLITTARIRARWWRPANHRSN